MNGLGWANQRFPSAVLAQDDAGGELPSIEVARGTTDDPKGDIRDPLSPKEMKIVDLDALDYQNRINSRAKFADKTLDLFMTTNKIVLAIISIAAFFDLFLIVSKIEKPSERLVNDRVILALIAGTVAELATLILTIGRNLFGSPNPPAAKNQPASKPSPPTPPPSS